MLRNLFELFVLYPIVDLCQKFCFPAKLTSYYTLHDKPVNFADCRCFIVDFIEVIAVQNGESSAAALQRDSLSFF